MRKNKKNEYRPFSINRLKKEWPFSLELAKGLFVANKYAPYSSLKDFFIYTILDLYEDDSDSSGDIADLSYSEKNEIIEKMGIWDISEYPGFFVKNNKVHYKETIKSKVKNSTKEEIISKIYTLDHIPYETILCEGTKFYINDYYQGSIVNYNANAVVLNTLSISLIWELVFHYLLWTRFSSSMKNMLEKENYKKKYEKQILIAFEDQFERIKSCQISLNEIISERSVFEERFFKYTSFFRNSGK